MSYILALDQGTSSSRSIVFDRKGQIVALAQRELPQIYPRPGWVEHSPLEIWNSQLATAQEALKKAGLTVSCDLNFRKNLWSSAKAGAVMSTLMPYVDIAIANEEDAEKVFGIKAENTHLEAGKIDDSGYQTVCRKLVERFGFKKVAITLRESYSASDNGWSAILFDSALNEFYKSKKYDIHIVDRVGGGDSFGGGLLYGLLQGMSNQQSIEFAVAASCLKHTIPGDFNLVSVAEVEALMKGDGSGRVQR